MGVRNTLPGTGRRRGFLINIAPRGYDLGISWSTASEAPEKNQNLDPGLLRAQDEPPRVSWPFLSSPNVFCNAMKGEYECVRFTKTRSLR